MMLQNKTLRHFDFGYLTQSVLRIRVNSFVLCSYVSVFGNKRKKNHESTNTLSLTLDRESVVREKKEIERRRQTSAAS